jgi:hypothetical protein
LIIYLDESGDLGFNFANKSTSKFFIITLLVCHSMEAEKIIRQAVRRTIKNKRITIKNTSEKRELKGTNSSLAIKCYFYKHICIDSDWCLYTIVVNKEKLLRRLLKPPVHKNLYNQLARRILENVAFDKVTDKVHLVIDRSKNKGEIAEFNDYVADHIASLLPLNIRLIIEHQTSCETPGIQAVDVFSWGIFKKYQSNDIDWYDRYKDRIMLEIQA